MLAFESIKGHSRQRGNEVVFCADKTLRDVVMSGHKWCSFSHEQII